MSEMHPSSGEADPKTPLAAAVFSLVIGLIHIVPVSLFTYAFEQTVLAPLGLAYFDPLFSWDPVFYMSVIVIPIIAFMVWLTIIMIGLARVSTAPGLTWLTASIALVLPQAFSRLFESEEKWFIQTLIRSRS